MQSILLISPYWKEPHRWMVSTVKLAELWQRLGYGVTVVCMGKRASSGERVAVSGGLLTRKIAQREITVEKISETLTVYRVPDVFLPDPWNYGIAFGFSGVALRLVRELKPDIIVVNKVLFWTSIALLRLRFAGYPVLLLTDALVGITWWPRGRVAKVCAAIYARTLGWAILLLATKIVFFHPQPPPILRTLRIDKKSIVIPTGIDGGKFLTVLTDSTVNGESRIASRESPSITSSPLTAHHSPLIVTYLGRLESVKGVDDFAAAAVKAQQEYPELRARIVGWYKEGHPLVAAYKDSIEFTGLRDDIPAVLAETDIFVLPSYSEGLSNALMEAMASGCACIASNVGGNRFLVQNGVSGLLFPAGDREALSAHIVRLARDSAKRTSLGVEARKRIDTLFSWEKIGAQYDVLFHSWPPTT